MRKNTERDLIFEAYKKVTEKKASKKKLTDLSGDGKITKKDVLIARGVKIKEDMYKEDDFDVTGEPGIEVPKLKGKCQYALKHHCTCKDCSDCQQNYDVMVTNSKM
jgi:hypothetical protein